MTKPTMWLCAQRRLRSESSWAPTHFVCFVMSWLIYKSRINIDDDWTAKTNTQNTAPFARVSDHIVDFNSKYPNSKIFKQEYRIYSNNRSLSNKRALPLFMGKRWPNATQNVFRTPKSLYICPHFVSMSFLGLMNCSGPSLLE